MPATTEALSIALELTRFGSVTESDGERGFAAFARNLILREAFFAAHPEHVWTSRIANDPHRRSNVFAFVPGEGENLVVLTGHFDVVSIDNYGPHQDVAFDALLLRERLLHDLRAQTSTDTERLALRDLGGEDFLPGRGLLDMKGGLAAGLAALYRFARQNTQQDKRVGNVLFVGVADEENYSFGARAAAPEVVQFAARRNLNVAAVINLDATSDQGNGEEGQALYWGSVGKVLAGVFVAGRAVHAGYSLDGINPSVLLSEIARRLEWNVALTDRAFGEMAAPPTALRHKDLKTHYDVTTPAHAWACFNFLTLQRTPNDLLPLLQQETQGALEEALGLLREKAEALGVQHSAAHGAKANVFTFAELLEMARTAQGPGFDARFAAFQDNLDSRLDLPAQTEQTLAWLWAQSGLVGPAAVLAFASLHYPAVCLDETVPQDAALMARVCGVLQDVQNDMGVRIAEKRFFRGISDMSWFGRGATQDVQLLNANTPTRTAQLQHMGANLPTINIGPWGRDYHQRLERVHVPYSFGVLPEVLWRLLLALN